MRGRWKDEGVGWFQTRLTLLCTSLATVQRVVAAVDDDDDDVDDDVMDGSRCLMTTLPSHQNIHHNICLHSSQCHGPHHNGGEQARHRLVRFPDPLVLSWGTWLVASG